MRKPWAALAVLAVIITGVFLWQVPEVRNLGGRLDSTKYATTNQTSHPVTVLYAPSVADDLKSRVEEASSVSVLSVKRSASLTDDGLKDTGSVIVMSKTLTPDERTKALEAVDAPTMGSSEERTVVSALVLVPTDDEAGPATNKRISETIGIDGEGVIDTFSTSRKEGRLAIELVDLLPPDVTLNAAVDAIAKEWNVKVKDVKVEPLEAK